MKKILLLCAIPALFFLSCKKDNDAKEDPVQYQVKLTQTTKSVEFRASATEPQVFSVSVACTNETMKENLEIALAVDANAVPAEATLLPAAAYTIEAMSVQIDKEKKTGEVSVSVSPVAALDPEVVYALPIRISCADEHVTIAEEDALLLITVGVYPQYSIGMMAATLDDISFKSTATDAITRAFEIGCSNQKMAKAIEVALAVDASALPTGATLLPAAAYTLPATASIDPATKKVEVTLSVSPVASVAALASSVEYTLPIRLSCAAQNVTVNAEASLTLVKVTKAKTLAAVPVGGSVSSCKDFFVLRDKYLIARNASTGDVLKYEYDAVTNSFGEPVKIFDGSVGAEGGNFSATNIRFFAPGPDNTIHYVVNTTNVVLGSGWNNVWVVQKTDETVSALKSYDKHDGKISTGCNIFYDMLKGPHSTDVAFVHNATAGIMSYGIVKDQESYKASGIGNGTTGDALFNYGPATYKRLFIFKDDIYGIGADPGTLYRHKYNPSTKLFSAARTEVGSNWGQFLNICQFGDYLLCQKGNATLVMYEFDPDNFTWDANYVEPAE